MLDTRKEAAAQARVRVALHVANNAKPKSQHERAAPPDTSLPFLAAAASALKVLHFST